MSGIYRFINTTVPTNGCNLRCEYCYVRQHDEEEKLRIDAREAGYVYSIPHMIAALSVERMGGVCMFNLSADGETLLSPDLFEIVLGLLRNGHYVALISNCTVTGEIEKYARLTMEEKNRLFFKASFHYRELKKRGLLNSYSKNINTLKQNSISFSVELVSNDYVLEELEEIKEFSNQEFGALPHVLGGREETIRGRYPKYATKLTDDEFRRVWGTFESPLFKFQDTDYLLPHNNDFCYAGVFTGTLDLQTGYFSACPGNRVITNFFSDIESPIQFLPVGNMCPFPFCFCGFFLQVLAGVCMETYDPGYKFCEFRDRICLDGSHWLTPSIREVFSHKCSEYHKTIDERQKNIINQFLDVVYHGYNGTINPDIVGVAKTFFEKKKDGKVAIYGMSALGHMVKDVLRELGINVVYGVDKNYKNIVSDIQVIAPENIPDGIDVMVVTAFGDYPGIRLGLESRYSNMDVCSVLDMIGDTL